MGLQSALTTALTGLQAAETTIDVVGNNVANSSTVGFKESDVLFATQFLQTQSIGSAPTDSTGGTNPRQIGLGVKVAAINPDFTQGTIQISSNPLDVAIQGDGFLLVEGFQGEQLFTRNGQLQTNAQNEIVTATGNRVLGLTVDSDFNIIEDITNPVPISIPLGVPVAQETTTAFFQGNLSPSTDIGTSGVITSQGLGNGAIEVPSSTFGAGNFEVALAPDSASVTTTIGSAGTLAAGNYLYKVVWYTNDTTGTDESPASAAITANGVGASGSVLLGSLPTEPAASSNWDGRRVYRSSDNGTTYYQIGEITDTDTTLTFNDNGIADGTQLDTDSLDQEEYSYYVTFRNTIGTAFETRPTALIGPFSVDSANRRILIENLPQPSAAGFSAGLTEIAIYRNLGNSPSEFRRVGLVNADPAHPSFIDTMSDTDLASQPEIDLLGPKAAASTPLVDVVLRDGDQYTEPFVPGVLTFTGSKGGRSLDAKQLTITSTTTVGDLRSFMEETYGIDTTLSDGAGSLLNADGELVFTSNAGIANELGADLGSFTMTPTGGSSSPITFDFDETADAQGQGTTTNFVVFDTLGDPVSVRLTTVREASAPGVAGATYRWFASSGDNEPTSGVETFLASGQLIFDLNGNIVDPADGLATISIDHPAAQPLVFDLDFNSVSGLQVTNSQGDPVSTMSLTRQDGFPTGTLTSFTITESGLIRGVFSNGAERPLGQLLMAKFANTTGLQQVGSNMYQQGINSGEPIINIPGAEGIGTLTAGAVELSNTDIGQNLIELILASTQYRGGARVITTAQTLLDELLNLRR